MEYKIGDYLTCTVDNSDNFIKILDIIDNDFRVMWDHGGISTYPHSIIAGLFVHRKEIKRSNYKERRTRNVV